MFKIAILYICIGKYEAFWKDFFVNFEQYFLCNCNKEYFVFTDADSIYGEKENSRVHRIFQQDLGWPGNTLFRFQMFASVCDILQSFDFIFFMNANVICKQQVTEDMILPLREKLVFVQHPGYYNKKPYEFEYDRNKKSLAYIPYTSGEIYVCGGVNGGKAKEYIKLIQDLNNRIAEDYEKGIIARWHDESHINKYVLGCSDFKLLSPSFCYPEGWEIPFEPIMMVLDKQKKIALDQRKVEVQKSPLSFYTRVINKLRGIVLDLLYRYKKRKNSWKS